MRLHFAFSLMLVVFGCVACLGASAQAPVVLFPQGGAAKAGPLENDVAVMRNRAVSVDLDALGAAKAAGTGIVLDLFEDVSLEGVLEERLDRGPGSFTWRGRFAPHPTSRFVLTVEEGILAGMVLHPKAGLFSVGTYARAGQVVKEIDPDYYPRCAADGFSGNRGMKGRKAPRVIPSTAAKADPAVMDVLVVYTPATLAYAGSVPSVRGLAQLAIDLTNTAYGDSNIDAEVRMVGLEEVSYAENGDMSIDLALLTGKDDSFMDEVHTLRNQLGADLVSLLVDSGDSCGIAWIMNTQSQAFNTHGFSVTRHQCIANHTFGHELGHNLGCAHDRDNTSSGGLFSYSYGWRFNGTDSTLYRTVMSYSPGLRITHFSNPDVSFIGTPTGVAVGAPLEANNALTIEATSVTAADFRPTGGGTEGEGEGGEGEGGEEVPEGMFCGGLHSLYTSELLATIVPPEYQPLFDLLDPEIADLNGGYTLDPLAVFPNGMLDCAYELGVIERVLEDTFYDASATGGVTHVQAQAAFDANIAQIEADVGPAYIGLIRSVAPNAVEMLAAYMTLGDENSAGAVIAIFTVASEIVSNPNPDINDFVRLPEFFSADGDADGDGATNREEYEAYASYGASTYVAFALDVNIFPGTEGEGEFGCFECAVTAGTLYTVGDDLCLAAPDPVAEDSTFQWVKTGADLTQRVGEVACRTLFVPQLTLDDSGEYICYYDDGSKAPAVHTVDIVVNEGVPISGFAGLVCLAAVFGMGGAVIARKKARR